MGGRPDRSLHGTGVQATASAKTATGQRARPEPRAAAGGRPGQPLPARRRLRDLRDQQGLRVGWIRVWLRGMGLGIGLAFLGVSLAMWPMVAAAALPIFLLGIALFLGAGLMALLTWILPGAWVERVVQCPACGHAERVLRLPWRVRHTCRHCVRKGWLEPWGGQLVLSGAESTTHPGNPPVRAP